MIYPSADIIEEKVGSRYSLVVLAAKRAKQIKEGAPILIDTLSTNPLTIALEEIAAGKVTIAEAAIVAQPSDTPARAARPADSVITVRAPRPAAKAVEAEREDGEDSSGDDGDEGGEEQAAA